MSRRAGSVVVDKTSLRYDCFEGDSSRSLSTARFCALLIAHAAVNANEKFAISKPRSARNLKCTILNGLQITNLFSAQIKPLYYLTCRWTLRTLNYRLSRKARARIFKLHLVTRAFGNLSTPLESNEPCNPLPSF